MAIQYEKEPTPVAGYIEVPASVLDEADEGDLFLNWVALPNLVPVITIAVLTDAGPGTPVHCDRVGSDSATVAVGVPADAAFPALDDEVLTKLADVPGTRLVLMMQAPA